MFEELARRLGAYSEQNLSERLDPKYAAAVMEAIEALNAVQEIVSQQQREIDRLKECGQEESTCTKGS